jgi:hypothetical protein
MKPAVNLPSVSMTIIRKVKTFDVPALKQNTYFYLLSVVKCVPRNLTKSFSLVHKKVSVEDWSPFPELPSSPSAEVFSGALVGAQNSVHIILKQWQAGRKHGQTR